MRLKYIICDTKNDQINLGKMKLGIITAIDTEVKLNPENKLNKNLKLKLYHLRKIKYLL